MTGERVLTARQQRILALAESAEVRALTDAAPEPTREQLATLALLLCPPGDDDEAG